MSLRAKNSDAPGTSRFSGPWCLAAFCSSRFYFQPSSPIGVANASRRAHRAVMLNYLLRRLLYAIPILIGVNLITFALFFVVNTPDDMARMQLGVKHVTPEAITKWKAERGYDKPLFVNAEAQGVGKVTDTILFTKSARLFV